MKSSRFPQDAIWSGHVSLVLSSLNEKERRWVAGLLSEVLGYGGTRFISSLSGLDVKTIRRGRHELLENLEGCPKDRVRRAGAGRIPLKKVS